MAGRPTVTTLALLVATFLVQTLAGVLGVGTSAFSLSLPLGSQPWTVVLSVYAHGGVVHLIANAVALAIVGPLIAYVTTPARFHAFFLTTGALSGVAQVVLTAPFGNSAVVGASGAIFGLFGYLLVGNRASERALSWLPLEARGRLLLFAAVAGAVTLVTAADGVALVAHFVGVFLGAVAGRLRLLHRSERRGRRDDRPAARRR